MNENQLATIIVQKSFEIYQLLKTTAKSNGRNRTQKRKDAKGVMVGRKSPDDPNSQPLFLF